MQTGTIRTQIPALSHMTYLDSAGAGLPPVSVTESMKDLVDDWSRSGEHWEDWLMEVVETRKLFAQLIGAEQNEVAVVPSVSLGLVAIASSVDLSKKRRVVTSSLNFPTNIVLWQRMKERGLIEEVTVLEPKDGVIPLEDYEHAIRDDTAIVSVDYVSWFNGYRERIREISEVAHKHNALMLVDGFHALGVFPVDVERHGIDVLVSGFYKWLCGPHGVACVYVKNNLLRELDPAYIGWHGIRDNVIERVLASRDPFDVPFPHQTAPPSATTARFEWGTWATVAVRGALKALKFNFENNPENRYTAIKSLRKRLIEELAKTGARVVTPYHQDSAGSGIVTVEAPNHMQKVRELSRKKIIVSGRFGHIRVSPHFYNTADEVDAFIDALRPMVAKDGYA